MVGTLMAMFGLSSDDAKQQLCETLGNAVGDGKIRDFVTCHLKTILQYYRDVHIQLAISFVTATMLSVLGFVVLVVALAFRPSLESTILGSIGGALLQFIAATVFWLYGKTSRQFESFHVCLERTCRYLLGYLIARDLQDHKDDAFRDLVRTMANAPMINIDRVQKSDDDFMRILLDALRLQSDQKPSTPSGTKSVRGRPGSASDASPSPPPAG
jgi:hypothetical protein